MLPKIFQSKARKMETAWYAAIKAEDPAKVGELLDGGFKPLADHYIALIKQKNPEVLKTFIRKSRLHNDYIISMANSFLGGKRYDMLEAMFDAKADFNSGSYNAFSYSHPLRRIFDLPDKDHKLHMMEKIMEGGIDKVDNRELFLYDAIRNNFPEALDIGFRYGLAEHINECLNYAATTGKKTICLHLIENYGADIGLVRSGFDNADNENKNHGAIALLDSIQSEMNAALPVKPATLDMLSGEMKELRAMIAELTQEVRSLKEPGYAHRLDKPKLRTGP